MFKRPRQIIQGNLWNRLARDLIYDSKQVLLYCGVKIPSAGDKRKADDHTAFVARVTQGTRYGAIHDPATRRIHFEPDYIQDIVDLAYRFDFPVFDKAFGPGGIAGFIQESDGETPAFKTPSLNHILKQALMAKQWKPSGATSESTNTRSRTFPMNGSETSSPGPVRRSPADTAQAAWSSPGDRQVLDAMGRKGH